MPNNKISYLPATEKRQRVQKLLPYSVSIIGGTAELAQWKKDQAESERLWQLGQAKGRKDRRANAIAALMGEKTRIGLSEAEQKEIDYILYILRRSGKAPTCDRHSCPTPSTGVTPPPKSLYQKTKDWLFNVFTSAFYSKY